MTNYYDFDPKNYAETLAFNSASMIRSIVYDWGFYALDLPKGWDTALVRNAYDDGYCSVRVYGFVDYKREFWHTLIRKTSEIHVEETTAYGNWVGQYIMRGRGPLDPFEDWFEDVPF